MALSEGTAGIIVDRIMSEMEKVPGFRRWCDDLPEEWHDDLLRDLETIVRDALR